jgi:uncharacterized protein
MQTAFDADKRKLLSALCHGAVFFSPLVLTAGIPLGILLLSDDPVVKTNARESLNFHFNIWLCGAIAGFIGFFWWTLVVLPLLWVLGAVLFLAWVAPIFAILKCLSKPEEPFRYPFIFRIL